MVHKKISYLFWTYFFFFTILSQSYKATVFYFDNISFLELILNQLKFNQSSILPHNGFNNAFPTVQETNHFMEVG